MTLNKMIKFSRGFTLIELMVVIALIGIIVGALGTSVAQARQRAKIERARSEASILTQAILAYENYKKDVALPEMEDEEASLKNLSIFIGEDGKRNQAIRFPPLCLRSSGQAIRCAIRGIHLIVFVSGRGKRQLR
jgi:prepilin-type N-terminal cleavage/methylation domain-containing protein